MKMRILVTDQLILLLSPDHTVNQTAIVYVWTGFALAIILINEKTNKCIILSKKASKEIF